MEKIVNESGDVMRKKRIRRKLQENMDEHINLSNRKLMVKKKHKQEIEVCLLIISTDLIDHYKKVVDFCSYCFFLFLNKEKRIL